MAAFVPRRYTHFWQFCKAAKVRLKSGRCHVAVPEGRRPGMRPVLAAGGLALLPGVDFFLTGILALSL